MLRTTHPSIRNYADNVGETATGGNFLLSIAGPRHIHTAQIISQPQKPHSEFVRLVTAVMYQVAGLTCSFFNDIGLQPAGVIHNNLVGYTHHLFFHVWTVTQPTITRVSFAIKRLDAHVSLNHVSTIQPQRPTPLWILHNRQWRHQKICKCGH